MQARRDAGYALSVGLKVLEDPRSALTEADALAQQAIIGALREAWPGLRVVGEEDERPLPMDREGLRHDLCTAFESDAAADMADITVFVDPLDGTREFVEGRLQNCQTLVGVSVRGRAVAGAIGVPFPAGDLSVDTTVVYGLVGAGTGTLGPHLRQPLIAPSTSSLPRPYVVTGDSTPPIMEVCLDAVLTRGGSRLVTGGAGKKILAAALGDADLAIQHKYGGPWDVCASEAVLVAMGGRLTDLFGDPIATYGGPIGAADSASAAPMGSLLCPVPSDRFNELGFVASGPRSAISHDSLVRTLRATPSLIQYREGLSTQGAADGACARATRTETPRMGLFDDVLWPSSRAVAATVHDICCENGWDVRCTLGFQAASSLRSRAEDQTGAPLPTAVQESTAGDMELEFSLAFDLEPGSDPGSRSRTRGAARLLSKSRFLSISPETGTWKVTSRDDDEVPTAVRWCLRCAEVAVSGDTLVPEGTTLHFTALTTAERRQRGLDVGNGRVAIREDSSILSALFGTRGIVEEFKTVGRFEIKRRVLR